VRGDGELGFDHIQVSPRPVFDSCRPLDLNVTDVLRPTKILFDSATSSHRVKSKAAYVIAHELGHQWFGNLVTMKDWSELWLNEGFATWAGYTAVDELFPEWDIWSQYVSETVDDTLKIDSLPTTHAIKAEVSTEEDALQMFDNISYFKGSSAIRMLVDHIGQKTFLAGLSTYLTENSYGNASSQDLWRAMSMPAGQDVGLLMHSWIHSPSFPVVMVSSEAGSVSLRQTNILALSDIEASEESANSQLCSTQWNTPLGRFRPDGDELMLVGKEQLEVPETSLSVVNKGHCGSYAVAYDSEALLFMLRHQPGLSSADLAGMVADMSTLLLVGMKSVGDLLGLILRLKNHTEVYFWLSITRAMETLYSIFSDEVESSQLLQDFTSVLLRSMKSHQQQLSRNAHPRTSYKKDEMEKNLHRLAALASDTELLSQARTTVWNSSLLKELKPHLRTAVLSAFINGPEVSAFSLVLDVFHTTQSIEIQEDLLTALAATTRPDHATRLLDLAFCDNSTIDLQHLHVIGGGLGRNGKCRRLQWEYIKRHWDRVSQRLNENGTVRAWFLEASLSHFADAAVAEDIEQFFAARSGAELVKPVDYIMANIRRNAQCRERSRAELRFFVENELGRELQAKV
jgi:aminopeptidase N